MSATISGGIFFLLAIGSIGAAQTQRFSAGRGVYIQPSLQSIKSRSKLPALRSNPDASGFGASEI